MTTDRATKPGRRSCRDDETNPAARVHDILIHIQFKVKTSRYSKYELYLLYLAGCVREDVLFLGTIGLCRMHTLGAAHLVFPSLKSIIPGIVFPCSRLKYQGTVNTSFIYCTLRVCAGKRVPFHFPAVGSRFSRPLFSGFPGRCFPGFPTIVFRVSRPYFFRVPRQLVSGFPDRIFSGISRKRS